MKNGPSHLCFILLLSILLLFSSACGTDDDSSKGSDQEQPDDDDITDDDDDDDDDDDNDDNDNNDDDAAPYWAEGQDLGPVSLDEYRPLGTQGLNAWEWEAGIAAKDALLVSESVLWVATLDVENDEYSLWHHEGEIVFTRTFGDEGLEFDIIGRTGPDPFPSQDPMLGAGYDAELDLFENPDHVQMPEYGYDTDDPRVGWVPDDEAAYPRTMKRITQIFDSPHGPDIAFDFHARHGGGPGWHGNLGVFQSRAVFLFSGAGVNPGVVINDAADLVDLAPTVLALLGADVTEGVDHRGHRVTNSLLTRQDGIPRAEIMTDPSVQGLADQVVVFLFDGLAPNELYYHYENQGKGGEYLPNFFELIENGTFFKGGGVVGWPSVSLPGHTTMGTGTYQGHHGILSNDIYRPDIGERLTLNWFFDHVNEIIHDPDVALNYYLKFYHEEFGVETLFEAVHRSFGDWDLLDSSTWHHAYTSCVNELTFIDADYGYYPLLQILSAILPPADDKYDESAYRLADFSAPIQVKLTLIDPTHDVPKLTLASFYITDHQGEAHGPHSNALRGELPVLDRYIGMIMDAFKKLGVYERTAFVVTSDHGMELVQPGTFQGWTGHLNDAGIKYYAAMGEHLLFIYVMRLEPDAQSLPAGVESSFTVTVIDDFTGAAIEGADLTLTGGDCAPCEETTDSAGQATFTVTPASGEDLMLEGAHPDFSPAEVTIDVTG